MTAIRRNGRILIGLFGLTLVLLGLWLLLGRKGERMKCIQVAKADIRSDLASLQALAAPQTRQPRRSVTLHIDLDASMAEDGILAIQSSYQERPLSLGPYSSEITVSIDAASIPADGYDIWRFTLFRPEKGEVCLWPSDEGFPFWREAKRLRIRLLQERQRLDEARVRTYVVEPE